ncbi:hypothetical protein F5Y18DRAFT_435702 [Xylariaceae sp. FL1019]|nr:hypothetical protein F5Y18DRAFT_435702 [Xylariaceae sp. FL1019]
MLTPAVVNIQSFFYPIGNTPAISLTQSIPPGDPADILLLGCGDVRNILFTVHNDCRILDITCCDNQKAVIARNVLLLSLIIDDDDNTNGNALWNIYYHMYLDKDSLKLLRAQSRKLQEYSNTMDTWQQSKYGRYLSFCDLATLSDVRKMWEFYGAEHKGTELARFEARFKSTIDRAKTKRQEWLGDDQSSFVMTGLRSASPAHMGCLRDLHDLHKHYWKYGTTELKAIRSASTYPNPAVVTVGDGAVIHYGTDPLYGFHLAGVDAPLDSTDASINRLPRREKYAALARAEFGQWMVSYREHCRADGIRVRFYTGDALAFAHTLQHKRVSSENTAHWYRDRYGVSPLVLDGSGYSFGAGAPIEFDVIDTSNLCDHLGSLTLLTAATPLLRDHASAVLYTEVLAKNHKCYRQALDELLCGHVPTLSTLLGLFPTEYWSNSSPISIGDENMFDTITQALGKAETSGQMFLRTSWKRAICMSLATTPSSPKIPFSFDPKQLASILYGVYVHMFLHEDLIHFMSNITLDAIQHSSLVWYQRPGFVSFLRLVQTRVTCDWDAVMEHTMNLIENRSNAPMGMNYYQELNIYLHMLGVYSTPVMKDWSKRREDLTLSPFMSSPSSVNGKFGDLRDWRSIPPLVCVTLKIPRKKMTVFTSMGLSELGTPVVHCQLQGVSHWGMKTWQYILPACQLAFGKIVTHGKLYDDSFEISVQEDETGWSGMSPIIASFFAPAFPLLQHPRNVQVSFGVHSTPASAALFSPKLGNTLDVYKTTLDDTDAVYVTRFAPNQNGFPIVTGFTQLATTSNIPLGAKYSTIATVNGKTGHLTTLTGRLDLTSGKLKNALASGSEVTKSTVSPCTIAISFGLETPLYIDFPVFVKESSQKLRIARKSSWVEVVVKVAGCSEWMNYPHCMVSIYSHSGKPINCNTPYIDLQKSPVMQITQHSRLRWLTPHLGMAMSARERTLREKEDSPRTPGEQIRLDFKESLFSIFIQFSGLQGTKSHIFYLNNAMNGGVHVMIFASALRLNLADRAAVLDCAVLPLHDELMPKIMASLAKLQAFGVIVVKVNDAELLLWRHALPAYVERCRTWAHRDDCEYVISGSVPLNKENGKPLLCTCGSGKLPPKFVSNVPGWDVLSKYAVRAAISPAFWAPFADDVYCPDLDNEKTRVDDGCLFCGKVEQADGSGLLFCARCTTAKYCSRECQQADWRAHKSVCNQLRPNDKCK